MTRGRSNIPYWGLVTLVAAAGLAVRVGLALAAVVVTRDAAGQYLPVAEAWQRGIGEKMFAGGIAPLYPMLTGCVARLIGGVEPAGRIISIVGGAGVLLFVFLLAYRLVGRWTACVALALAAFHPYLCRYAADIGPDSLGAGLLAGGVYGVCAYLLTFSFWNVLLAAAMLAGLALTRPEGFAYAPAALLVMLVWPAGREDTETRRRGDAETRRHGDTERRRDGEGEVAKGPDKKQRQRDTGGQAASGTQGASGSPSGRGSQGGYGTGRRRVVHVGVLVVILVGLCVPRLMSVHSRTGVWALDVRQRSWSARIIRALRSGEPDYGQWRIWSRGGMGAVGGTVESTVAGFGPAGLIFGIYGLAAARRLRRRRVALVIVLFVLYSYALILVGNRISKRYLLGPAALLQVWAAVGIMLLSVRVRVILRRRRVSAARLGVLPVAAGLIIAALQLPWVPQRLHIESMAERRMGEWMAANLPAGTRVMAMDPVAPWYGRAVKVNVPTFKPSRLTPTGLALRAKQVNAEMILVDARGRTWCPDVWARLQKGDWRYGRILHCQIDRKHTVYLLNVSGAAAAERDAAPRVRGRTHSSRQRAAVVGAAASRAVSTRPATTRPAGKMVRHPKGKRMIAASRPVSMNDGASSTTVGISR